MSKLSDKLYKYKNSWQESDDTAVNRYITEGHQDKTPETGIQYVGIEIESYSKMNRIDLQKLFFKYDLESYVAIGNDPTINPPEPLNAESEDNWHTFELRLLIPQDEMVSVLKDFGKVFRLARLKANESCGLHVHLDMRQRNLLECYRKLLTFQDCLFAIVNKDRWNNEFCQRTAEADRDHHMAINLEAYNEHQTIEIRMHHGCTNTVDITKWIKLLIAVVDSKKVPAVKSKRDVLLWKDLNMTLKGYVNRNFKSEWFKEKESFEY